MRKLSNVWEAVDKALKKIKLVDKCLIIFMVVLMIESIYSLFSNEIDSSYNNDIDIIIRTTSAAIFGYILSGNFMRKPKENSIYHLNYDESTEKRTALINDEFIDGAMKDDKDLTNTIECEDSIFIDSKKSVINEDYNNNKMESNMNSQQVIITTVIGLTALIVLMIARNCIIVTDRSIATISQMRDFVSGCVGYLLGCPIKKSMK